MIVDARAHSHSIVDGGARARTTRGRRDDERAKKNNIYIYARSRVARARARRVAGSKRREIDDEDDGC